MLIKFMLSAVCLVFSLACSAWEPNVSFPDITDVSKVEVSWPESQYAHFETGNSGFSIVILQRVNGGNSREIARFTSARTRFTKSDLSAGTYQFLVRICGQFAPNAPAGGCNSSTWSTEKVINQGELSLMPDYITIKHATSGMCYSSEYGSLNPPNDTSVVLSDDCVSDAAKFKHLSSGLLQHVASGKCIHPLGGRAGEGTRLVFWNSCAYEARLRFSERPSGSLEHVQTGYCVHPIGGAARPSENSPLVFKNSCDEEWLSVDLHQDRKYLAIPLQHEILNGVMPGDKSAYASECNGNGCVQYDWGVELQGGSVLVRRLLDTTPGRVDLYVRAASESGVRRFEVYLNGLFERSILVDAKVAPHGFGKLFGPFPMSLRADKNVIEIRNPMLGTPIEILEVDVQRFDVTHDEQNPTVGKPYSFIAEMLPGLGSSWNISQAGIFSDPSNERIEKSNMDQFSTHDSLNYCLTSDPLIQRFYGYYYPPETGMYQFALASDDQSRLYISDQGINSMSVLSSSHKRQVAIVNSWTSPLDFDGDSSRQSSLIFLEKGKKYYFEARHLQGGGPGHFAVGIKAPGASEYSLLNADDFSPYICSGAKPCHQSDAPIGQISYQKLDRNDFSSLDELPEVFQAIPLVDDGQITSQSNGFTFTGNKPGWYSIYFQATGPNSTIPGYPSASAWVEKRIHVDEVFEGGDIDNWAVLSDSIAVRDESSCNGNANCFSITSTKFKSDAEIHYRLKLEPTAAYEFSAFLRSEVEMPEGEQGVSSGEDVIRPYVRSGWKDSKVAISTGGGFSEVVTDFVVPHHGYVDLYIGVGDAKGKLYVADPVVRKMESDQIVSIETQNVKMNLHREDVATAGGYDVALAHAHKISKTVGAMEELTNKNRLACHKESQWASKKYPIGVFGFAGNPIAQRTLSKDVLENVWPTDDVIDGIYTHEFGHNFDYNPWKFGNHLSDLVEAYPLSTLGYKRAEKDLVLDELAYRAHWNGDANLNAKGCFTLNYFQDKLFEFKDIHGWGPIREIMRSRASSNNIGWDEGKEHLYIKSNYMRWWDELFKITGDYGWESLHSDQERLAFSLLYDAINATNGEGLVDPSTVEGAVKIQPLQNADFVSAEVGWGSLGRGLWGGSGSHLICTGEGPRKGIYAHAKSNIKVNLSGKWKRFKSEAGVQWSSAAGSVVAIVKGDGRELFKSSMLDAATTAEIDLDVSDINILELEFTDGGNGGNSDWSIWIDPILTR